MTLATADQNLRHARSSSLSFAVISVADMAGSLSFYCDLIGFDIVAQGRAGPGLAELFELPQGSVVETALLSASGCDIGRILLVKFNVENQARIRRSGDRTTRGLWNLNFYVADIRRVAETLASSGFELWSEPVEYDVGSAGRAIEVLFEAPDGVAINLVQPLGEVTVFTGRVRSEVEAFGYTRGGFTPVATTAHCVTALDVAARFYQDAFDLDVVLDEVLGRPETNYFLSRPAEAKSRTVFLSGDTIFGKLSLNQPLNYEVPERVADARAPAIGYLAQAFEIDAIRPALMRAGIAGAHTARILAVPGLDACRAVSVSCPGSGASAWLLEKLE